MCAAQLQQGAAEVEALLEARPEAFILCDSGLHRSQAISRYAADKLVRRGERVYCLQLGLASRRWAYWRDGVRGWHTSRGTGRQSGLQPP